MPDGFLSKLLTPEAIGGTVATIGGGYIMVKRLGWKLFQKSNNSNGKCPDPGCQAEQKGLVEDMGEIKPKVIKTAEDVQYIRGWIEGQK